MVYRQAMRSFSIAIRRFVATAFSWKISSSGHTFVARVSGEHVARMTEDANGFGIMFDVRDWNSAAIDFYRRIGAAFLNDWKTVCLQQEALQDLAREV